MKGKLFSKIHKNKRKNIKSLLYIIKKTSHWEKWISSISPTEDPPLRQRSYTKKLLLFDALGAVFLSSDNIHRKDIILSVFI